MTDDDVPDIVRPLVRASESEYIRGELLAQLGWDLDQLNDLPPRLATTVQEVLKTFQTIIKYLETPPETLNEFGDLLDQVGNLTSAIRTLGESDWEQAEQLGEDLLEYLIVDYLHTFYPTVFESAVLLGLIRLPDDTNQTDAIVNEAGELIRYEVSCVEVDLERIPDLLIDLEGTLKEEYLGDRSQPEVQMGVRRLVERVARLLNSMNMSVIPREEPVGRDPDVFGITTDVGAETALLKFEIKSDEGEVTNIGVEFVPYVDDEGNVSVLVVPRGDLSSQRRIGSWGVVIALSAAVDALLVSGSGATFGGSSSRLSAALGASRLRDPETGTVLTIGGTESTRLEIGGLEAEGTADVRSDGRMFDITGRAADARFVLSAGDGDGFLQSILPEDGVKTDFDLEFGWTSDRGLHLQGNGSMVARLPIHRSLGDILTIQTVDLSIGADTETGSVPVHVATTAGVSLGPVEAIVEKVGLKADLSFPDDGSGTFGPVDVDLKFKPPGGAGLSVDAAAIVGGGYLFFDSANERYVGTLQLSFGPIAVDAVGLLTTKLPGGRPGFSLLLLVTGEFPPIQLGFGFTLNALGGLVGINRTTMTDVLQTGVRNGTLQSVLFPKNVEANTPQIISDLRRVFPPAANRHTFGPMARIEWGTPTILSAEVGILLELPAPVRLFILGRLSAQLPHEDAALIRLQMDALGVIDFDEGTAAVDASLYDSRVVSFPVTGDMAVWTGWGAKPGFALSIGGFHPAFTPIERFPDLRRATISLASGNNPRLRCETYLAVTSNSFQIGANVDLHASSGGFSVEGNLGFDTLLMFDPFRLDTEIRASVALKRGGKILAGIALMLGLTGPAPWHARGEATLKILLLKVSINFDKKFGSSDQPPPLPPVSVVSKLRMAISDERNWSAQVPSEGHSIVSLREIKGEGRVLVHPLADLTVRQRIVPLGVDIDKLGNSRPSDGKRFSIESITVGDDEVAGTAVREQFAPCQYRKCADHEMLSGEQFQRLPAGQRVESETVSFGSKSATKIGSYETKVIDRSKDFDRLVASFVFRLNADVVRALANGTRLSATPIATSGTERFTGPSQAINVTDTKYVVAETDSLQQAEIDILEKGTTKIEAQQASEAAGRGFRVVPRAEVRND